MRKIKQSPFIRSGTTGGLPNIGIYTPRSNCQNAFQPKSTYLNSVDKQISVNVQYEQKDYVSIGKQQNKLKNILKKMNEDTVKLIGGIQPRQRKHNRKTATSVLAIKDKEMQNNTQILQGYKVEVEKLKQRQMHMESSTKEQYEQKIVQLQQEIEVERAIIKELEFENGRRGKQILNQNAVTYEGELKKVETDKYISELKLDRLMGDSKRVKQQTDQINRKMQDMQQKYAKAQRYLKEYQQKVLKQKSMKKSEEEYHQRKSYLQNYKKKNEFYHQNHQFRYYRQLQKLDGIGKKTAEVDEKISSTESSNEAAKSILQRLQGKLKKIKDRKVERENNLNEFLQQTQRTIFTNRNRSFINNQMPSQIIHKNEEKEEGQNNEYILLNQEEAEGKNEENVEQKIEGQNENGKGEQKEKSDKQ